MRVVIDTNVVVSAALKDLGPERVLRFLIAHPEVIWVASAEILQEYREVLARPRFGLSPALVRGWIEFLESAATSVAVTRAVAFPRDRKDAKFLACALSAGADFLITGDRHFESAERILETKIVSVSIFERRVCDVWEER